MTTWVFQPQSGAAVRRDPKENQLFKTEQAEEGEYAGTDALVREILQNSMDASEGSGPVRIRLALFGPEDLPARERIGHYFQRLESPLQHRDIAFDPDGVPQLDAGFLVCEDFGTRGLGGDPLLARDPQPGSTDRQDFFWFWRNIGRSGKTGDDLGRWGLGKTVYRAASQVGCMLGLTVRKADGRQLLMGQAVLRIHDFNGDEYAPEGYWCAGTDGTGFPLPIEEEIELNRFREEWKLKRESDQPGLSVVVPYIAKELKGAQLLQAVCVHFFVPIIRKQLVVELRGPDLDEVQLDHETIAQLAQQLKWDGPKRTKRNAAPPINFVDQCFLRQDECVATSVLGETKLPELNEESFDSKALSSLRNNFADEKLVGVKVQISLPKKSGGADVGEMLVFVQRDSNSERLDTYYVREGMTITKLNSRAGSRGIHAFVNVDKFLLGTNEHNPLASLLGDSEGPAHEDWDTSEDRPDKTWKTWKGRVKFCRRIVDNLVDVLAPPTGKPDFDLLSDFFSVEKSESPQRSRKPSENGKGEGDLNTIESTPRWYRLDGRTGGFRLVSNTDAPRPKGAKLRLSVAYDLPSGNPLKRWSVFDFDFNNPDGLDLKGTNVKAKAVEGNVLLVQPKSDSFAFSAEGFDELRDLYVRVDEIESEPGVAEANDDQAS